MNWRAIGSATSGGLVWASPDPVTRPPACLGGRGDEPLPRRWEPAVSRDKVARGDRRFRSAVRARRRPRSRAAMRPRPSDDPVTNTEATAAPPLIAPTLPGYDPEWSPCSLRRSVTMEGCSSSPTRRRNSSKPSPHNQRSTLTTADGRFIRAELGPQRARILAASVGVTP